MFRQRELDSSAVPAVTSLDFAAQTVKGRTGAFTNLPALLLPKGLQPRLSYSVIVNITFFKCIYTVDFTV